MRKTIRVSGQRIWHSQLSGKDFEHLVRSHVKLISVHRGVVEYSMRTDYWTLRNTRKVRRLIKIVEKQEAV